MESPVLLRYCRKILVLCVILAITGITGQVTNPCKGQCGPGTKCTQTGTCLCETGYHRFSLIVSPDAIVAHCFQTCDLTRNGCVPNTTCVTNLYTGEHFCKCDEGFSRSSSGQCLSDKSDILETTTEVVVRSSTDSANNTETTAAATIEPKSATDSISAGQIAGIVVGIIVGLLVIAAIVVAVVYFLRIRNSRKSKGNVTISSPVSGNGNSVDNPATGVTNPDFNDTDEHDMWNPSSYSVLPLHAVSSIKPESRQSTDQDSNGNSQNPYTNFDLSAPSSAENTNESQT